MAAGALLDAHAPNSRPRPQAVTHRLFQRLLDLATSADIPLHIAVEILMLTDCNEIYDVPLIVDGICNEPLVILCLKFFHPDLAQRPSLAVSPMRVLEDLRLDSVEPANDRRLEPFAIFTVAWRSKPRVWHLPPPPLHGLGKSFLNLSRPLQDLLNEPKG